MKKYLKINDIVQLGSKGQVLPNADCGIVTCTFGLEVPVRSLVHGAGGVPVATPVTDVAVLADVDVNADGGSLPGQPGTE